MWAVPVYEVEEHLVVDNSLRKLRQIALVNHLFDARVAHRVPVRVGLNFEDELVTGRPDGLGGLGQIVEPRYCWLCWGARK